MVENGIDGMCVIVGDVCLLAGLFTIMYVCYYLVRFVVFHLCPNKMLYSGKRESESIISHKLIR